MTPPLRPGMGTGAWTWLLVGLALGVPAALAGWVPLDQTDSAWPAWARSWALHPDQGWTGLSPQALWTCAWLHGSATHLYRNLAALLLLIPFGISLRVDARAALAWLLAWPLTHIGMLNQPLHTYIGMSGALHSGAIIIALNVVLGTLSAPTSSSMPIDRHQKISAWILLIGLILKIIMENPWQHVLIRSVASDINVAPWAHLSGVVAGAALYISLRLLPSRRRV